jgi:hypothetical protein
MMKMKRQVDYLFKLIHLKYYKIRQHLEINLLINVKNCTVLWKIIASMMRKKIRLFFHLEILVVIINL